MSPRSFDEVRGKRGIIVMHNPQTLSGHVAAAFAKSKDAQVVWINAQLKISFHISGVITV